MFRRALAIALLAFAALLGGCQDYNFNPVGRCVFQPAVKQATLSNISTADILFVVDDSGSMEGEQQDLANNFQFFIEALAQENRSRVGRGLEALDFHIAITTTGVFANIPVPDVVCGTPKAGFCVVPNLFGTGTVEYACATNGAPCGFLGTTYAFPRNQSGAPTCIPGHAVDKTTYPQGSFVAAANNPRVLHFTKDLDWQNWQLGANPGHPIDVLIRQFRENIQVGTCGSPHEQGLAAARLAIEKAAAGTQPGIARDEWLHPSSKLVVIFVGDEDDCSTPNDRDRAVLFDNCTDSVSASRLTPIPDFTSFFQSLGREFAAAFIVSADPGVCRGDLASCSPLPGSAGSCCGAACDGTESGGVRFVQAANALQGGARSTSEVFASSICGDFSGSLRDVANLVKPLDFFALDTEPAANEVVLLRILGSDGRPAKTCARGTDWWFIDCNTRVRSDDQPTACIHIEASCERNPGEAISAEYLGRVPVEGCATSADCVAALGQGNWTCDGATATRRGTCLCQ